MTVSEEITPEYKEAGRIPTLNNMGWAHPSKDDEITGGFLEYCTKHPNAKVLEIGAAYGHASIEALKCGAEVFVNDLDIRHLEIFKQNVPENLLDKIHLLPGDFPDGINLETNSFDAILAVRVLHFFAPEKLERAVQKIYDLLKTGGNIYISTATPYLKNWAPFIPVFEQRKASGEEYPGYFTNLTDYNHEASHVKQLPSALHYFDPEILTNLFTKYGFKIKFAGFMNRADYPENVRLDGREGVGIIATKI